jgi:hypothetical protein
MTFGYFKKTFNLFKTGNITKTITTQKRVFLKPVDAIRRITGKITGTAEQVFSIRFKSRLKKEP